MRRTFVSQERVVKEDQVLKCCLFFELNTKTEDDEEEEQQRWGRRQQTLLQTTDRIWDVVRFSREKKRGHTRVETRQEQQRTRRRGRRRQNPTNSSYPLPSLSKDYIARSLWGWKACNTQERVREYQGSSGWGTWETASCTEQYEARQFFPLFSQPNRSIDRTGETEQERHCKALLEQMAKRTKKLRMEKVFCDFDACLFICLRTCFQSEKHALVGDTVKAHIFNCVKREKPRN